MSIIAKPPRRSLGTLIGGASYGRAFRRIEPALDADAAKYLAAVEAADKQVLEDGVKRAVSNFVRACKAGGNWDAIKASCILCGARTLSGALVPLKGTAPTNNNFVAADYTRGGATPGLKGDGSTKWLNSNRADNADGQNNAHISVYVSTAGTGGSNSVEHYIGGYDDALSARLISRFNQVGALTGLSVYIRYASFNNLGDLDSIGFMGGSRAVSGSFVGRVAGSDGTVTGTSVAPSANQIAVFAVRSTATSNFTDARLAFYSIGEAVNLATLDTAVSTLVSEIGAAV